MFSKEAVTTTSVQAASVPQAIRMPCLGAVKGTNTFHHRIPVGEAEQADDAGDFEQ